MNDVRKGLGDVNKYCSAELISLYFYQGIKLSYLSYDNCRSFSDLAEYEQSRLLFTEEAAASFISSPEHFLLNKLQFTCSDQAFNFLLISLLSSICPHGQAHGRDDETTDLEGGVAVI